MQIPPEAKTWVDAMKATEEGRQILANIENDQNVPERIAAGFFALLCENYVGSADPLTHMIGVLVSMSHSALAGPDAGLGIQLLMRFAPLARLGDLPSLRTAGINVQMIMASPELVDIIEELPLGNRRGIVWAAAGDSIQRDLRNRVSIAEIIDRLGIAETMTEPMYRASYSTNDIDGACHVPTVLDAGHNARFRPAPEGAASGRTVPVSGSGEGYPEYVHSACTIEDPGITVHTMD